MTRRPTMTVQQRWVLALTSVASFMISLDSLVVTTALTTIRLDLGASLETLEWTVAAYNLAFAGLLLTAAALGERFGRRRVFVLGLLVFAAASAACALAPNAALLIAARVLQGVGAAVILPLAFAQLTVAFPPAQRGRALGLFAAVTGLATGTGPLIGGAITGGLAWPWIFWLNVPIAAGLIVLVLRRLEESGRGPGRLDLGGAVLATGGCVGVVWALVRATDGGLASMDVIAPLGAGILLLTAFVLGERHRAHPMMSPAMFGSRAFVAANGANFLLWASLFGLLFFLAQYLQVALGGDPLTAGLRLVPCTATLTVVAPLSGILADRLGARPLVVGGLGLQACSIGWLVTVAAPGSGYGTLVVPLVLGGCGVSLAMPAAQKAAANAVAAPYLGQASGVINTLRILGGAFGTTIAAALFAVTGSYASPDAFTRGFGAAMTGSAVLAAAGALVALALPAGARSTDPFTPHPTATSGKGL